jgi:hypothetical protein
VNELFSGFSIVMSRVGRSRFRERSMRIRLPRAPSASFAKYDLGAPSGLLCVALHADALLNVEQSTDA